MRLAGEAAEKLRISILAWTLASASEDADKFSAPPRGSGDRPRRPFFLDKSRLTVPKDVCRMKHR